MKKKVYTLLKPNLYINPYNWTFWEDRALVRVEEKNYRSKILEYKFDLDKVELSNPKILLQDPIFSYEDPRLISKKDFTYVKYNSRTIECFFMRSDKGNMTKGHAWEKNWQHLEGDEYIYKIRPFIIRNNKNRDRFNYHFDWPYGNIFHLSSNLFEISNRQFLLFHTYTSAKIENSDILTVDEGKLFHGTYAVHSEDHTIKNNKSYYQGVIELVDLKPKFYVTKPLFDPPEKNNPYKFPKNKSKCVYVMSVRNIDNELWMSAGVNDCESALIKIDCNEFIDWVDEHKNLVEELPDAPVSSQNLNYVTKLTTPSTVVKPSTLVNYEDIYHVD